MGNLVNNLNRGIFAEWLVGQALGVISDSHVRDEWDSYDLPYGERKIEVKASGRDQTFRSRKRSQPRFDVAPRKWSWLPETGEWIEHEEPVRFADIYVFCLHVPVPATNENVRDRRCWKFWVISKQRLDDELGPQKTVGLSTLGRLANSVGWSELRAVVDRCVDGD